MSLGEVKLGKLSILKVVISFGSIKNCNSGIIRSQYGPSYNAFLYSMREYVSVFTYSLNVISV